MAAQQQTGIRKLISVKPARLYLRTVGAACAAPTPVAGPKHKRATISASIRAAVAPGVVDQTRQLPAHGAELALHAVDVCIGVRQLGLQQGPVRRQRLCGSDRFTLAAEQRRLLLMKTYRQFR